MTAGPSTGETAEDFLNRARELFSMADHWLTLALGPPRLRRDQELELDPSSCFVRAHSCAEVASAGARIAQAMNGATHLDMLREFEERVEGRTASEDGQPDAFPPDLLEARPDAFPCTDCDYLAPSMLAFRHHFSSAAHGRPPYVPPTLTGPYDPDREHDR